MNKGLIMEVKDDYAIVMCDDGTMDRILVKPGMSIGQKIFYFEEDIVKSAESSNKKHFNMNIFMKSFGSIAALFLIVFTVFQNLIFSKAYAVVSIDINPSIEITADNKKNIIKVEGKNLDGQDADFQEIKNLNINDGIKKIKDILIEKDYLSKNKDVLVAVGFPNNDCDTEYAENIKGIIVSTFDSQNVACVTVDKKEDIKEANEKGISLGRYEAYKVADEVTKKNIKNAPVKELTAQIKDQDNVVYWDSNSDEINNLETIPNKEEDKSAVSKTDEKNNSSAITTDNETKVKDEPNKHQESKLPSASIDKDSDSIKEENNNTSSSSSNMTQEIELKPEAPSNNADKKEDVVIPLQPQPEVKPEPPQPEVKPEIKPETKPDGTGTGSTIEIKPEEDGKVTGNENVIIDIPKKEKSK
ncbi:anti-sigma factor domain-containing protein [Clostridium sp. SM-530-WT-3G]|uniref:anti-sigma-I factor RsgI family protein n=1 Tax=Clostridium sp. SM-530-WT-3G TaxID=2725303 RepID=UPI00145C4053|nr:anti-sigma factor domain-containing protein [Clostridium sp. SM-530-WT-3G]NME82835.1 anti-sigma factor domain-containing protein [Clostridium sp. SM-530-WT-3G]